MNLRQYLGTTRNTGIVPVNPILSSRSFLPFLRTADELHSLLCSSSQFNWLAFTGWVSLIWQMVLPRASFQPFRQFPRWKTPALSSVPRFQVGNGCQFSLQFPINLESASGFHVENCWWQLQFSILFGNWSSIPIPWVFLLFPIQVSTGIYGGYQLDLDWVQLKNRTRSNSRTDWVQDRTGSDLGCTRSSRRPQVNIKRQDPSYSKNRVCRLLAYPLILCSRTIYSPRSCRYLQRRQNLAGDSLELAMAIVRNFPVKQNHLKTALKSKSFQIEQTE